MDHIEPVRHLLGLHQLHHHRGIVGELGGDPRRRRFGATLEGFEPPVGQEEFDVHAHRRRAGRQRGHRSLGRFLNFGV